MPLIRIDDEAHIALTSAAEKEGRSVANMASKLIKQALTEPVSIHDSADPPRRTAPDPEPTPPVDDGKLYMIVRDGAWGQQTVRTDMSHDDAWEWLNNNDIDGDLNVIEQPKGYKQPTQPATTKRRKR